MTNTIQLQTNELLTWYTAHKRDLPWRADPSPYHVWLSEIMLQQTRVEAVKSYYTRFLKELPDIPSLALAEEDTYLKLWEGLGYYSRVRNLHKAANQIMVLYSGQMPENSMELQKLAGIGEYTSAAIASIAFGEPIPAVDGNLLRIFARITAYDGSIKDSAAKKAAFSYFMPLIQCADNPGNFNQALMDLGSAVCIPVGSPLCETCPWSNRCHAHLNNQTASYPVMPKKKERRIEPYTVLLIHTDKKIFLHKRPEKGLLAGMYELPLLPGHLSAQEIRQSLLDLSLHDPIEIHPLSSSRHLFTHIEWQMTAYDVKMDPSAEAVPLPWIHASVDEIRKNYSIPSAFSAYTKLFEKICPANC